MKNTSTDTELIDFKVFYRKYFGQIFHFCNKLLSSNHIEEAKEWANDFTEETFISVWERYSMFVNEYHAKAYAYTSAKNKVYNKLQEHKRRAKSHKEILYLSSEADPDAFNFAMINSDVIAFILEQVDKLPPQCSTTLKLFFKGFNSTQIASQMHCKRKTVLNQKLKGIGILKQLINLKYG